MASTKNTRNFKKRYDYNCGFSLLEVLVAAVIGLILLVIVSQTYLSAKNIYHAQNDLAYFGENMRFAEFFLWQNVMQAGFAGCRRLSELELTNHTGKIFGVRGYDSSHRPECLLNSKVVRETDIILIGKADSSAMTLLDDVREGATSFRIEKKLTTKGNQYLLISDCKHADLIKTSNYGAKTVDFAEGLNHAYRINNSEVRLFGEMVFFIGNTGRVNEKKQSIYSLYYCINGGRNDELVSDVIGMRVYYGININGSKRYLQAKDIIDPKLWERVFAVKIDLTMRSNLLLKQKHLYIKLRLQN